jgi:L-cystine transport system substrate-binding protein
MQLSRRDFLRISAVAAGTAAVTAGVSTSLVGCSSNNNSDAAAPANANDIVLYVGTQNDWPPFTFVNADGELDGLDIEFTHELDNRLDGYTLELQAVGWDSAFVGIDAGRIDIIIDQVAITDERKETYLFTEPYFSGQNVIFVKKGRTDIQSIDDLQGKNINQSPGDVNGDYIKKYNDEHPADQQINVVWGGNSDAEKLQDVALGKTDALILSATNGLATAKELGLDVEIVGEPLMYREVAALLPKNEHGEEIKALLDPIIVAMKEDGYLRELSVKWTERDFIPVK